MPLHAEERVRLSPALKSTSQYAFVLGDLKIGTVISLSQLCDNDCIALFMKYRVKIIMNIKVIITGQQDDNGLWSIPLAPAPPPLQADGILRLNKTKSELAAHHHASLGSPSTSTLLRSIRSGHLLTFPGLTSDLIIKHLPKSIATTFGHQDQEAKNLRSTQAPAPSTSPVNPDLSPPSESRIHNICTMLLPSTTI